MHTHSSSNGLTITSFSGSSTHARNERRTWFVVALTAVMMVAEITAGSFFGSMALLADGWHMATHVVALGIAALAYLFARRRVQNSRFAFGTGKFGELAAFSSAPFWRSSRPRSPMKAPAGWSTRFRLPMARRS